MARPAACCAEGTQVKLANGELRLIEHLRRGDELLGVDGDPVRVIFQPEKSFQPCFELRTENGLSLVASMTHTLVRKRGGYARIDECLNQVVKTARGPSRVVEARQVNECPVYLLALNGSHSYETNGIFSLE